MRCVRCKEKEVEISVKLSVNGKVKEIGLCNDCADIVGYLQGNIKKANFAEYIRNLIEDTYPKRKEKIICSICKTSFTDFLRKKLFGCPFCYIYLEKPLKNLIREIKNPYGYRITIENLIELKKTEDLDKLYLKLKTYLDYDDTQMAKRIISRIKRYDNSQKT